MPVAFDLTGVRFGRLIAVKFSHCANAKRYWECLCDCGKSVIVMVSNLRSGNTRSCGCLQAEESASRLTTHGLSHDIAHAAWISMLTRCNNERFPAYNHYGGRGITVCSRWASSFKDFLEDMGDRKSREMTIDRIDNDGNYSCGKCDECIANGWEMNCRWATRSQQSRNTRSNRRFEINGEVLCLTDWCKRYGVHLATACTRLRSGKTIEQALGIDIQQQKGATE